MTNCICLACGRSNQLEVNFCVQCGSKTRIQDRYRALEVIGQGGFGTTFLALDEAKPSQPSCVIKQFALQTINPKASQGNVDEAKRLFKQEAKRLDDLGKHPQIPELLAYAIQDGKQYLIQEFVDGETLEKELQHKGAFSEKDVQNVLLEVLQILEFVHKAQVIHRDISPDNIIRRRSDHKLVLVDFGAAKHATATLLAKTGTSIGKPSYGAPEQMRGKSVFQSDLYALGVTCLHLLTNVDPFTLYSALEDEYVWRQFLNGKTVSDKFGKLLDQLTTYRVKERPNSVTDVLKVFGIGQQQVSPQVISQPATPTQNSSTTTVTSQTSRSSSSIVDCGNGVKLELVEIPAGKLKMGSNHYVMLKEFWMGKYAVTQRQWEAMMGTNPSNFKGENLPVEKVSWHDAREFCQKLSQKAGKEVRLPTEAEWEYACRAGTTTVYAFGDTLTIYQANFGQSQNQTVDVDSYDPNAWGLYQMHGNVSEWCLDEWHEFFHAKPNRFRENGNEAWGDLNVYKNDKRFRILRGGSWNLDATICRSANRSRHYAVDGIDRVGFRVCSSLA